MVDGGFIDGVYVNDVVALNTGNAFLYVWETGGIESVRLKMSRLKT